MCCIFLLILISNYSSLTIYIGMYSYKYKSWCENMLIYLSIVMLKYTHISMIIYDHAYLYSYEKLILMYGHAYNVF